MIIHTNVCDFCGQQIIIKGEEFSSGIFVCFSFGHVKEFIGRKSSVFREFDHEHTFCDTECFSEFVKSNFYKYGNPLNKNDENEE